MQWSLFFMLISSFAIEIKILLINQILEHFVPHPVHDTQQDATHKDCENVTNAVAKDEDTYRVQPFDWALVTDLYEM